MYLGKNLKLIRKKWRLSQEDFANIFDVSNGSMHTYEIGRSEPKLKFLLRLYEVTGIPINEISTRFVKESEIPDNPGEFALNARKNDNATPMTQDPLYNSHAMVKKMRDIEGEMEALKKELEDLKKEK